MSVEEDFGKINPAFENSDELEAFAITTFDSKNTYFDDETVYANLSEINRRNELENIDRKPFPPFPDAGVEPNRILPSGWREYKTLGGRYVYTIEEFFFKISCSLNIYLKL